MTFIFFLLSIIVDVLCCSEPFQKKRVVVSPGLDILFLIWGLLVSLIVQDYHSPMRHFFPFVLQNDLDFYQTALLPAPHPSFLILKIFLLSHVFLHLFFAVVPLSICGSSPPAHLWLGLLIIYLMLLMLQSVNSGISLLQIAHTVLLVLVV